VRAVPAERRLECVLGGGDDYELAFTAPAQRRDAVAQAARAAGVPVTRIGRIEAEPGLRVVDARGEPVPQRFVSFDHFG
jgi:thiamine-monophosphate kinase